jgi:hypothetical protein
LLSSLFFSQDHASSSSRVIEQDSCIACRGLVCV